MIPYNPNLPSPGDQRNAIAQAIMAQQRTGGNAAVGAPLPVPRQTLPPGLQGTGGMNAAGLPPTTGATGVGLPPGVPPAMPSPTQSPPLPAAGAMPGAPVPGALPGVPPPISMPGTPAFQAAFAGGAGLPTGVSPMSAMFSQNNMTK
jgi:hypothetical protein